ncbi:hypothetical protein Cgig2_013129 [Carnegiea gigantea]|uniref:Uncharacterized protein n=1 Tax=Carnegiea gigantea TaxID=171969 RepID=A0A9Q1KQ46_9CARY|nr:hypothetical protein Cgig2_013129 [Carnegiea gigantea]
MASPTTRFAVATLLFFSLFLVPQMQIQALDPTPVGVQGVADLVDNDNVDGVTGSDVAGFFGVESLLHSPLDLSLVGDAVIVKHRQNWDLDNRYHISKSNQTNSACTMQPNGKAELDNRDEGNTNRDNKCKLVKLGSITQTQKANNTQSWKSHYETCAAHPTEYPSSSITPALSLLDLEAVRAFRAMRKREKL